MTVRPVLAIAQMPPPVTGLSTVNQAIVDKLNGRGALHGVINVGPSKPAGHPFNPVVRMSRVLGAIGALLTTQRDQRVLYMPTDSNAGLAFNLLLIMAARVRGYEVWLHHHNFSYLNRHSPWMERLIRHAPRGTRHIFLCSGMAERMQNRYASAWEGSGALAAILPNSFLVDEKPIAARRREGPLVLGHLSNLTIDKGSVRFIDLFMTLRSRGVDVAARLAGPIGDPQVADAIDRATTACPDSFQWLGPVYGDAKTEFYDGIDVFVFPTTYSNEAQPIVLLEALACGAAIVTTDIACIGCDHAEGPGVVLPSADFDEGAATWIEQFARLPARDNAARQAQARFAADKASAMQTLDTILSAMTAP